MFKAKSTFKDLLLGPAEWIAFPDSLLVHYIQQGWIDVSTIQEIMKGEYNQIKSVYKKWRKTQPPHIIQACLNEEFRLGRLMK